MAVLTLFVGAGAGYWIFNQRSADAASLATPQITVVHLEVFVVNLADADGRGYLRVGIDLGVEKKASSAKPGPSTTDQAPAMRDAIISVLSTRKANDLLMPEGKKKLKDDLIQALNARVKAQNVREIYFNEFLVQR